MKQRERLLLGRRLEVDEEVAAAHQIEARERGVVDDVVSGEHRELAQLLDDPEALAGRREVALAPLRADVAHGVGVVDPRAGRLERFGVDVGREDLGGDAAAAGQDRLVEQDGDRVHLLAGSAARHPDPDVAGPLEDLGQDVALEVLEGLGVAEEAGDADEEVEVERVQLALVAAQALSVGLDVLQPGHGQPPLDPAEHGGRLVVGEVDPVLAAQEVEDLSDRAVRDRLDRVRELGAHERPAPVAHERIGDRRRWQLEIDHAGVDRAARHPVEAGALGVLADDQAARLVHLANAARPVAAGPRQDDRDRVGGGVLGQRAQEVVDRQRQAAGRLLVGQQQVAAREDHVLAGGYEIDVVRLDQDAVGHLLDRDARPPGEQLDHPALKVGREVLEDDEGHAAIHRHGREQGLERLQAASRRADADDGQTSRLSRRRFRGVLG